MEVLPPAARGMVDRGGHCPARAQSLLPQGRNPPGAPSVALTHVVFRHPCRSFKQETHRTNGAAGEAGRPLLA